MMTFYRSAGGTDILFLLWNSTDADDTEDDGVYSKYFVTIK